MFSLFLISVSPKVSTVIVLSHLFASTPASEFQLIFLHSPKLFLYYQSIHFSLSVLSHAFYNHSLMFISSFQFASLMFLFSISRNKDFFASLNYSIFCFSKILSFSSMVLIFYSYSSMILACFILRSSKSIFLFSIS